MMRTLLMGQAAVFVADAVALGRLNVWIGLIVMAVLFSTMARAIKMK